MSRGNPSVTDNPDVELFHEIVCEMPQSFANVVKQNKFMKVQSLTVGLKVRHPQYGVGYVRSISERTAEIRFDDAQRTIDPELSNVTPADPTAALSGVEIPLNQLIDTVVQSTLDRLGFEKPDGIIEQLGVRWHKGKLVLHPADPALQTKE